MRAWSQKERDALKEMVAAGMSDRDIADALGKTPQAISKQRVKIGIKLKAKRARPVPADFRDVMNRPSRELRQRYRVSSEIVSRWREEVGCVYRRPATDVPASFAGDYAVMTNRQLIAKYKIGSSTIQVWRDRLGLDVKAGTEKRPIPDDFTILAPTMLKKDIMAHYRIGERVLDRWISETGVVTASTSRKREMPEEFPALAARHTTRALCGMYGVSDVLIARWRRECGIPSPGFVQPLAGKVYSATPAIVPQADGTMYGLAAQHLRRKLPCVAKVEYTDFRKKHPKGHYYVAQHGILPPDAMLELAKSRYGYNPDAWKIAA